MTFKLGCATKANGARWGGNPGAVQIGDSALTIRPKTSQNKPELTAERLRELLIYSPETGIFTRRITTHPRWKAGTQPGTIGNHGYWIFQLEGSLYLAHRLAFLYMTYKWPHHYVDHINCDKTDNRWCNLRHATKSQNGQNRTYQKNNTSGVCGVYWFKRDSTWHAQICVKGNKLHLGYFTDKSDAIAARHAAEIEHFGEFRHQPALDS